MAHSATVMGKRKIIPSVGIEIKLDSVKDDPSVAFI